MDIKYTKDQVIQYLQKNLEKFKHSFNENAFIQKIVAVGRNLGATAVYNAFRIYYTMKEGHLSLQDKILVMAALGYFIAPIDLIPDFLGIVGLTDDAIVIGFVTRKINEHVTPEIDNLAREKTFKIFGKVELKELGTK